VVALPRHVTLSTAHPKRAPLFSSPHHQLKGRRGVQGLEWTPLEGSGRVAAILGPNDRARPFWPYKSELDKERKLFFFPEDWPFLTPRNRVK
jgi:hypothetical protein